MIPPIKIARFNPADYLDSEEAVAEYLLAAREADDASLLVAALADARAALGMMAKTRASEITAK